MVCRPFATPFERTDTSEVGGLNNACSLSTLPIKELFFGAAGFRLPLHRRDACATF